MQIPVRCSCGTCAEWALIEFQGEVGRTNDDSLDGLSVGSLCVTAPETLQLTIGHHRVEGKQVQLKKPLAILRKSPASGPDGVAYDVVGVIRSKVHFKTRPLALISAPEAGKKRAKVDGASDFFKRDVPKAARFYNEGLGLTVNVCTEKWAELQSGATRLALKGVDGEAAVTTGYSPLLSFAVSDVSETVARCIRLGAVLDGPIRHPPHGAKVAALRAPDGHMIGLVEE